MTRAQIKITEWSRALAAGGRSIGEVTYTAGVPDARVRPALTRGYVGFTEAAAGRWLMPATLTVTVIVNLGEPFGGLPEAFVAGPDPGFTEVGHDRPTTCLDLKLTPLGAYRLLGVPMDELSGQAVELGEVLAAPGRDLAARLRAEPDWARRFDLLDALLLARLDGPEPSAEVARAMRLLVGSGGRMPIGRVAEDVGWSRRHLVAMVKRQAGLPPKTLARMIRFGILLDRLGTAPWERLAADCGYYDQAHLNRDFREFAGTTPAAYLREVTSVQDAPGHGLLASYP